ncbi:MAG: DMT family transporter, partial [Alphaproteobacteria bacterium]
AERMNPTPRDWLLLFGLGVIWGAAFMATKLATLDFAPLTIAGLRLGVAAITLTTVMWLRGARFPGLATSRERKFWLAALAVGILANVVPFTTLSWAQRHIDSGLAGVLMTTMPLIILPLGHFFVPGERITLRKLIGFLIGFAGVGVLIGPDAFLALGTGGSVAVLAQAGCFLAALGYASGSIVAKLAPQLGPLRFGAASLILAALISMPLALALENPLNVAPSPAGLAAVLYLGLVPTALATVMLLSVIGTAGPSFLSLVNYQVPLWAVVFGVTFLGETPSPRLGIALVMMLLALTVAQSRLGLRRGGHVKG